MKQLVKTSFCNETPVIVFDHEVHFTLEGKVHIEFAMEIDFGKRNTNSEKFQEGNEK